MDKHGKIRDANDEFLRVTGHPELQDIIGTDSRKWVADYEKKNISNAIEQLMKTGKITGMEVDFKANDGTLTPIEFNATVIREKGDYHLLGIGRDISDRREAEREKELIQTQLRQAQKMESIGQLTGGIAHDFNNVLASILGYTELSQHAVNQASQNPHHKPEETNRKLETYLGSIHEAGTRARDLIQQLMVFSRSSEISPQFIQVEPAIKEITKLLSSSLPETINVTTHFEKDLPLIHIDPSQLYEVIMYLFYNSRDALHEVGEINIVVSHRNRLRDKTCSSCHGKISDDYIDITIKDNGPGIPEQHRDRVFEPFYTTKAVGQGTGMGLPMVHGIVHEHGGHILLDTSSQGGTTTHLLFPTSNEISRKPESLNTSDHSSNNKGHIAIVEDEESLANFLSDLFSNHGYKVTVYTDSRIARKELPSILENIDLILTDHTMPGITGTQLAKEILALKPDLPIILCTGFSFQIDEKTAYAIGIRRFLKKPISSSELLNEVEQLIQHPVAL
jgi:PAS domain S-box-containing protein